MEVISWWIDGVEMRLSEHFDTAESQCKCGCGFGADPELVPRSIVDDVETVRQIVDRPVVVSSWHRCPARNAQERGVRNSAHLRGIAVDMRVHGGRERAEILIASVLMRLVRLGRLDLETARAILFELMDESAGLGVASSFIHIDRDLVLPRPMAWTY